MQMYFKPFYDKFMTMNGRDLGQCLLVIQFNFWNNQISEPILIHLSSRTLPLCSHEIHLMPLSSSSSISHGVERSWVYWAFLSLNQWRQNSSTTSSKRPSELGVNRIRMLQNEMTW